MGNWTDKIISNLKSIKIGPIHIVNETTLKNAINQTQKSTAFAIKKRDKINKKFK